MKRALLLDRDGVINEERGYVWQPEAFIIQPEAVALVKAAYAAGWGVAIITNQGGIARGLYTEAQLDALHRYLASHFERAGVQMPFIYYCPHHPEEAGHYGGHCLCRKPQPLLFERALARLGASPHGNYMVGDRDRDLQPACAMGMTTVMVGDAPTTHAHLQLPTMAQVLAHFVDNIF